MDARAYILQNQVTHARLLPVPARHAFRYPTFSLFVPLGALEAHRLDLARGWVFGYGGLYGRLTGLRAEGYLTEGDTTSKATAGSSIKEKLVRLLETRGYADARARLHDAWLQTMPSFLGYEGINPLSVYYCYTREGVLWMVVLEIHNTFGERHVHLLELGKGEGKAPKGFDHQWTFPRAFHVSPFNDRSGFYTVSIVAPSHPPFQLSDSDCPPPLPAVRVDLHLPSEPASSVPGQLKLTATIRPASAKPLTTSTLLAALARAPLALLLSFPRILYQAGVLHYTKRLDVYARPEPHPALSPSGGGVGWQPEGALEACCRRRVAAFLARRRSGAAVVLVSADPAAPPLVFAPENEKAQCQRTLTVRYTTPRFFATLFAAPSAAHALRLAGPDAHAPLDRIFAPSDRALFLEVFGAQDPDDREGEGALSFTQRMRTWPMPRSMLESPAHELRVPRRHPLDVVWGWDVCVLALLLLAELAERWVFGLVGARFVQGQEPWGRWERAEQALEAEREKEVLG